MASPLKAVLDIRRRELPLALLMFGYFFLVITSFWILKPIKKSIFITHYKTAGGFDLLSWSMSASQAEQLAKVMNMIVAVAAVAVFTMLARRFRREQLTFIFCGFFVASYAAYTAVLGSPGSATVWSFYLFGDLFSTIMVATFFAFLNDSVTPAVAKRIYGLVGMGGVVGGVVGTTVVRGWIDRVSAAGWLWTCAALAGGIAATAWGAGRAAGSMEADGGEAVAAATKEAKPAGPPAKKGGAALEGARLVFGSRYLLSVAAIVGLYEICSAVMDFQFTATVEHFVAGPDIGRHFSTIYMITNVTSMIVQFFLTSLVMTRFGVTAALLVLPVMMLAGSGAFLAAPFLWVGSLLNTADNGFSYSINQSAKEALYVPTTRDEKYKAKAFIDMFVQRFAKSLAVAVNLTVTTVFASYAAVRWLSVFTALILAVWILAARFAGRKFQELSETGAGRKAAA